MYFAGKFTRRRKSYRLLQVFLSQQYKMKNAIKRDLKYFDIHLPNCANFSLRIQIGNTGRIFYKVVSENIIYIRFYIRTVDQSFY